MTLQIEPTSARLGAFVRGFDRQRCSRSERDRIYAAFLEHGVLIFQGLTLDVETHIALAELLGVPEEPHQLPELRHKEDPRIRVFAAGDPSAASDPDADTVIGQLPWHADRAYTEFPGRGAVLRAIVIPEEGGRTGWIDTAYAYRTLPSDIKIRIQGLRIVHSFETARQQQSTVKGSDATEASHPLVFVHPETDMPGLWISPATAKRIVGLGEPEGEELLRTLIDHVTREEHAYVHDWSAGDAIAWDNWRTIHRAYGHPKRYRRVMNSLQLKSPMKLGRMVDASSRSDG